MSINYRARTLKNKRNNTMNTPLPRTSKTNHHPMMIIAAIAIILFCLAGTAAIMGWIPSSIGVGKSSGELTASDRAALASRLADSDRPLTDRERELERERELALRDRERDQSLQRERELADQRAIELRDRDRDIAMAPVSNPRPMMLAQADEPVHKRPAVCGNCGRVESVRAIKQRAQGSGVGAAGGAILGGLLGNQVGGGNGRKLATVAGAVGGAVVGNQVEGNMKATTTYEVHVRMDNGKSRTFHLNNQNGYDAGDRIKVVNGALRHAG
jgi:outer membrane lipoprotein SlyB